MELALVVAIVGVASLEVAEKGLQEVGVRDITVTKVKGYGEYADFLSRDHLVERVKIEAFVPRHRAQLVANVMVKAAGAAGEEFVAILPVDALFSAGNVPSNA